MANINPNEKSSASQCAQIQAWLENGNTITTLEALNRFGCIRLASRINDLRNRGVDIKTDWAVTNSGKRIAVYSIAK